MAEPTGPAAMGSLRPELAASGLAALAWCDKRWQGRGVDHHQRAETERDFLLHRTRKPGAPGAGRVDQHRRAMHRAVTAAHVPLLALSLEIEDAGSFAHNRTRRLGGAAEREHCAIRPSKSVTARYGRAENVSGPTAWDRSRRNAERSGYTRRRRLSRQRALSVRQRLPALRMDLAWMHRNRRWRDYGE
jgi:hypothetical protein